MREDGKLCKLIIGLFSDYFKWWGFAGVFGGFGGFLFGNSLGIEYRKNNGDGETPVGAS